MKVFKFIPSDLNISSWDDLKPYFEKMVNHPLITTADLESLLFAYSETLSVFHEQNARAYINMTCHTDNKEFVERHELFATQIMPEVEVMANAIQKRIIECDACAQLNPERYGLLLQDYAHDLKMFRPENVALNAEISKLSSDYGQLAGSFTAQYKGKDLPLPQVGVALQSKNRDDRKEAWTAIMNTYQNNKVALHELLDQMIEKRHQVALNGGFKNFRDYSHENLKRFDYTVEDVLEFHESIALYVVPLKNKIAKEHAKNLGLENDYRPWDASAPRLDEVELKPFKTSEELLTKTKRIFEKLSPQFRQNLEQMEKSQLFDLDSRKGKAPGGYNYGLEVTGMPFIFMNSAGIHRDMTTLMHEGGHAMHTFLTADEPLIDYRHTGSEMAETASMSMELMTQPYWSEFYSDEATLKQARREHLEDVIDTFPWVATVDAFQHWLYTHPTHTQAERSKAFSDLMTRYGTSCVSWEGIENIKGDIWLKQAHIFEVPFYYIEYAIAQMGALQMYRQFLNNPQQAIQNYIKGLSLGSTKPLPELWDAMGIKFDFSASMIRELMSFVADELDKLAVS